jgi:DNA-binding transcriptional ArsR family regulator
MEFSLEKIFSALASTPRRRILAYLSAASMTAGEIAQRFDMSKPSLSKHLSILENAGLISREKKGQYVHYSLVQENLVNTLHGFAQEICPAGGPIVRESRAIAQQREGKTDV